MNDTHESVARLERLCCLLECSSDGILKSICEVAAHTQMPPGRASLAMKCRNWFGAAHSRHVVA